MSSILKVLEALGRLGSYLGSNLDPCYVMSLVLVVGMKFECKKTTPVFARSRPEGEASPYNPQSRFRPKEKSFDPKIHNP